MDSGCFYLRSLSIAKTLLGFFFRDNLLGTSRSFRSVKNNLLFLWWDHIQLELVRTVRPYPKKGHDRTHVLLFFAFTIYIYIQYIMIGLRNLVRYIRIIRRYNFLWTWRAKNFGSKKIIRSENDSAYVIILA